VNSVLTSPFFVLRLDEPRNDHIQPQALGELFRDGIVKQVRQERRTRLGHAGKRRVALAHILGEHGELWPRSPMVATFCIQRLK